MDTPVFSSSLKEAIQRALSGWLYAALKLEIRSYTDLVKCFGVKELITSLSPEVRGKVFCACNGGGDAARAAKIDAESVALMISSMLKDVIVDEAIICREVSTDHMVEVLPNEQLYALVFGAKDGDRPWDKDREACKKFMAASHAIIHAERVLEPDEYVSILEEKIVHEQTPTELLVLGQLEATRLHRAGKTFSGAHFIEVYAPDALVGYVALTDLHPAVEAVAKQHGWIADEAKSVTGGLPPEALDSTPPTAPATKGEDSDEPELSVSGPISDPPDALLADVEADDLEELESSDEENAAGSPSSPPPLGRKKKDRRQADRG
jgi:hypothetical protein